MAHPESISNVDRLINQVIALNDVCLSLAKRMSIKHGFGQDLGIIAGLADRLANGFSGIPPFLNQASDSVIDKAGDAGDLVIAKVRKLVDAP